MLKKTIKYTDFNDDEVEEDYYFHLSKAELVELEMSVDGGLSESLKKLVTAASEEGDSEEEVTETGRRIVAEFKKIILGSYGQRSGDGKRFIKNQELRDEFESSEAYSTLFMELMTDMDAAIEFINGIIPKGLAEEAAKVTQLQAVPDEEKPEPEIITREALTSMPHDEFVKINERLAAGEVRIEEDVPAQ